ncbi:hypothetical protein JQ615_36800 [Bradyrhizobium jicamae]|uniref:ATP-dependent DNA ligase family profile domain-containing protein n=1 Tax=Bradyrhizobium jicamae TaxID=280332 RepID=A0ABS5FVW8_9BRAD|nr:hypothetical protein [Bradyrhizobium jicamae]MBR0800937.1 hypothetical protein [Bradyrhizobium jicamae]
MTRKAKLERLLQRRAAGIFVSPFETGAIGPDLFRAACDLGLEGLVSKRSDRPYLRWPVEGLDQGEKTGRSTLWIGYRKPKRLRDNVLIEGEEVRSTALRALFSIVVTALVVAGTIYAIRYFTH